MADESSLAGTISRVVHWPFAPSAAWVAASYRLQSNPAAMIGMGAENAAGTSDKSPVAVPMTGTAVAGQETLYDVAQRGWDPEAGTLTAYLPSSPTQGTSRLVTGKVGYTPQGGTGGQVHTVPVGVKDAALQSSTSIIRVSVSAPVVGNAYDHTYKYPAAATLDVNRIKPWRIGTALPAHIKGDTILAYGSGDALTGDSYEPPSAGQLKGSLVHIGETYLPIPRLYGADEYPNNNSWANPEGRWDKNNKPETFPRESNPNYKPFMGVNHIWNLTFAADAEHHDTWEAEPGFFVKWPVIFFANLSINYETNACNFGDFLRAQNLGSLPMDTSASSNRYERGNKVVVIYNKVKMHRGAHYCDQQVDSTGKHIGSNAFHFDGIQTQKGLVSMRLADCHFNWIMGQNVFCGLVPETEGFPRRIRQHYSNVSWEHALPWGPKGLSTYCPDPENYDEGSLQYSPRMIMNYEGGFGAGPYVETTKERPTATPPTGFSLGQYWPIKIDSTCYIKSKWLLNQQKSGNYVVRRYINPPQGISAPITGTAGDYTTTSDNVIGPTQLYKPYDFAAGAKLRLLDKNQTLPVTVQDSHVGSSLRVSTAAAAAAVLKA